jgi:hypothetical protein
MFIIRKHNVGNFSATHLAIWFEMMRKICKSFGPGTKQPKEPYYNSV